MWHMSGYHLVLRDRSYYKCTSSNHNIYISTIHRLCNFWTRVTLFSRYGEKFCMKKIDKLIVIDVPVTHKVKKWNIFEKFYFLWFHIFWLWFHLKNLIDKKFPDLTFNEKVRPTIKGLTLHDILVIRNWIYFAKLNGDEKIESLNNQIFESSIIKQKFSLKNS